jgi:hypothetical protein
MAHRPPRLLLAPPRRQGRLHKRRGSRRRLALLEIIDFTPQSLVFLQESRVVAFQLHHAPAQLLHQSNQLLKTWLTRLHPTANYTISPKGAPGKIRRDGKQLHLIKAVKKSANAQITSEMLYQLDCERRK